MAGSGSPQEAGRRIKAGCDAKIRALETVHQRSGEERHPTGRDTGRATRWTERSHVLTDPSAREPPRLCLGQSPTPAAAAARPAVAAASSGGWMTGSLKQQLTQTGSRSIQNWVGHGFSSPTDRCYKNLIGIGALGPTVPAVHFSDI